MSLRAALRAVRAPAAPIRAASTSASASASAAPAQAQSAEPTQSMEEMRTRARRVYKELHRLGRDYPDAEYNFNMRLRRAFEKNAKITDPVKLKQQLDLAEHIKKEILAMYSLRKYRHLRRAYTPNEAPREFHEGFSLPADRQP